MKTNLKTFPKHQGIPIEGRYQKWLEDFKKELREIVEDYKNHGELRYSTIELIKDILGKP